MNKRSVSKINAVFWLICGVLAVNLSLEAIPAAGLRFPGQQLRYAESSPVPTLSLPEANPVHTSTVPPVEMQAETSEPTKTDSGTINILLIGQDRLAGEGRSRSDSMILCTFRIEDHSLTLTSILRDLYVSIPGHRDNRINAAYITGGMELLNATLEQNLGIRVDGNIEVDFQQFAGIIDLLGGVRLELRQDEAQYISQVTGSSLGAGLQQLTGAQALAYARIRKLDSDGDFSRTRRQRTLLEALLKSYRNAGLSELLQLPGKILPMVTTDMTKREILELIREAAPSLSKLEIRTQHIPAEGTYSYRTIRGMSVLVADMEAARQLVKDTVQSTAQ